MNEKKKEQSENHRRLDRFYENERNAASENVCVYWDVVRHVIFRCHQFTWLNSTINLEEHRMGISDAPPSNPPLLFDQEQVNLSILRPLSRILMRPKRH